MEHTWHREQEHHYHSQFHVPVHGMYNDEQLLQ